MGQVTTYIYALVDPRTDMIRYVGKSNWPDWRLKTHCWDARTQAGYNPHREYWLRQLESLGLSPQLKILEECPESDWEERECWWIAHLRERNEPLMNLTPGGDAPPKQTGSLKNLGRRCSDETRRKISEAHLGRKHTDEARARMSAGQLGRKHSEETKRKMSEAQRGKKRSEETCRKMSEVRLGRSPSVEARQHMSDASRGKKKSDEHRRKIQESHRRRAEEIRRPYLEASLKEALDLAVYLRQRLEEEGIRDPGEGHWS